ncbi:hypothetical protein GCM10010294_36250 [Streptomyces griseoloalbus]|nr:hypothetical protein GCM10010294_36250 [Streptomyces griseoloalbus]
MLVSLILPVLLTPAGRQENGESERPIRPSSQSRTPSTETGSPTMSHPYVGMWVTADHHIRQELLADGRYDEARGDRESAYTGRYWVEGDHIRYADDTGFTADGTFDSDVLYHGGYVFYREGSAAHREAATRRK